MGRSKTTAEEMARIARFGAPNYAPIGVCLARGEGALVWDVEGKRYFDLLSGYSALSQGHCHPRIVATLIEQAQRLTLASRVFYTDTLGEMMERVSAVTGFEKVLPMNTGAEAVESAIKAMRRWAYERKGVPEGQAEIVVMAGNFHGRTTTIVGFSDDADHRRGFGPPTPGFVLVPWDDPEALRRAIGPRTAGVLMEPIQGEAGVRIPRDGFLRAARQACTDGNALLCFDEVQTGLGRTGKMFAWQHENVRPDLMCLGKALGGGVMPVSCIVADEAVMGVFTPGSHGSTFGGNPLAAAVAVAALDVLEHEELPARAAELGLHALRRLHAEVRTPALREIRGRGFMIAVEYHEKVAPKVAAALAAAGVLAKDTHGTTLRILPPLVIERAQLDEALDLAVPILAAAGR